MPIRRSDPFGSPWGLSLIGMGVALFLLGLFLSTHNPMAATICTGLAVLVVPFGAILLVGHIIEWGLVVIAVAAMCLLLVTAVVLLIRLMRRFRDLASDGPNTPETNKLVDRVLGKTDSVPRPSSPQPQASPS